MRDPRYTKLANVLVRHSTEVKPGNKVMIQTEPYGGGEIFFDDVLVRKNGLFVLPELEGLNSDRLG